ncbi:MAG: hypothetical protein LBV75_02485, partial [Paludibacter sp.]|nr:hypothetical protein [Paludibacter sp.]
NSKASPVFHLAYKYTLGSRFGLGATIAAGTEHSDFEQSGTGVSFKGKKNSFIGTLAGEASFNYVNSQNFKLYGLAGIGGTFINLERKYDNGDIKTDGKIIPDFQITPIGLKFGNNFGGFAELGFGYKGLVNIGFFARF